MAHYTSRLMFRPIMTSNWQDRWRVIEETPSRAGGHAIVHHVAALDDGREGALKMLSDDAQALRERRFRMRQEVSALRALSSGVPKLFDTNVEEAGQGEPLFIVMEWIPGPTLAQAVTRTVMSFEQALACTNVLLDTLNAMHALPLVHRDLKPDNIILRHGDVREPVIIDLGLAWADTNSESDFETEHGQEMGNRFLRLPEFAPGRANRDPRSDTTQAAGLLLFMLIGRAPRLLNDEQGRAPHEALADHIPQPVKSDRRWPRLSRVFGVAFQTEVSLRSQTIADLRDALSNLEPSGPPNDDLTATLERFRGIFESERWQRQRDRETRIGELGAKLDAHLRSLLRPTGLSLPGGHGFRDGTRLYRNGICLALSGGGIVCTLQHNIEIGEKEFVATYRIERGGEGIAYYRGPVADIDSLEEAMWHNAKRMVAFVLDEFNQLTTP